ncbi:adenosylcobyric acid synthase [Rhizobium leguminosarum]|uniref:Cobyric acid synthase n=1 Tax=Rhizobium leguminosarum TaxID=384 RepID=A0AAE2MJ99_RHILE|nr:MULTISPECIES: cobyric acid synthase [Rhizobium]MBB4289954.1 adenosylcobyric acid synthase [Rhizobium leguminosarum]MBB4296598.1 adenosylcobyric acid synthase [Rhizobium leguminosarum]MBB4308142.1 adenosylcobyric acid synthase [Rhizobium leguminosarum]MBB4415977.1 adenosylcobyric acid synthase [Rhizobium leguminosarum]MBB4431056.1 adenosylcobyric acid synthase [Rhizobium esperanzae]
MARAIMLQGTGSDVGKTVLVAGLCRLAANRGLAVRPFKPQNMSNNAAVADDGGEIGRAQWLQSLAARTPSSVHMNPVLLKPQSDNGSQIIVQGRVFGQAKGRDYQRLKPQLLGAVLESFEKVAAGTDLVIVEGAGSPAEINLRPGDIANMGFATRAGVPVVLVGDIDRGGVIASLVGTHAILDEGDRAMIAGYIINKFRGDISLFDDGISAIEGFTGWPCFGVVPWLPGAGRLPAEDSVVLERLARGGAGALKIAVPVLPRIANFDDLDPLRTEPDVELVFVRSGERIPADASLVVLPGSKSTISDLADFRAAGWDRDLQAHVRRGGRVIGICGGYQMLGRTVHDPLGREGGTLETPGLGLLDVETEMASEKTVRNSQARSTEYDTPLAGYQIHLGITRGPDCDRPSAIIDGAPDGALSADGRIMGTYLHGLFGSDAYRARLLQSFGLSAERRNYRESVDRALDEVASGLQRHLDPRWLAGLLG